MEALKLLATLLPLSLTSGINLYATLAVVGLSAKYHLIAGMPKELDVFGNWWVIGFAIVFYIIEFIVDKFEFFDNAWDVISTFIRPIGGVIIGINVLGSVKPELAIIGAMLAGGIAFEAHAVKSGTRVALNVACPFENVTNPIISLAEDGFVIAWTFLALNYPYGAAIATVIIIILLTILVPKLIRWTFFFSKAVFFWIRSCFKMQNDYDDVPAELMSAVDHADSKVALSCKCTGIQGINGRYGYLLVFSEKIVFVYKKWFGTKKWGYELKNIPKAYLKKRLFVDIIEIPYKNAKGKSKTAHFVFLKTRRNLVEKVTELINKTNELKED